MHDGNSSIDEYTYTSLKEMFWNPVQGILYLPGPPLVLARIPLCNPLPIHLYA